MLGDKSQTPTRHELLSMVRKHSKLIGKTVLEEEETPDDLEMDSGFWHDMIDLYFVRSRESRGREDDDLIFFVRKMNLEGQRPNDNGEGNSPYFVRRWAPKLDDLVGENSIIIDWRRFISEFDCSYLLQCDCSNLQVLKQYQTSQGKTLSPIYKVVKTVYASPSRINFHLDSRKEVETSPAYPDICFAVDDFDSTFDAVVLTDPDHCYCVLLNANDRAAFPHERKTEQGSSDISSPENVTNASKMKNSKISLFSGFVSYQMVRDAYDGLVSEVSSLWSFLWKTDRIFMKGPGGRGEVEVAVSGVLDQSKIDPGPYSPIHVTKKGLGIGTIVRTAASVASMAAKHACAAASSNRNLDEEMLPPQVLLNVHLTSMGKHCPRSSVQG